MLSARTPRSIGPPTRRRVCAAGGGDCGMDTATVPTAAAPCRRSARPCALTTRPSQPSIGRTAARRRRHHGPAAAPDALQRRKRHQQRIAAGKADHFAGDRRGRASRSSPARRPTWCGAVRPPRPSGRARRPRGRKPRRRRVPRSARARALMPGARAGNLFGRVLTACLPASLIITSPSLGLRRRSLRQDGRSESARVGCIRLLMWNMNGTVAKKPLSGNILSRFGQIWPVGGCGWELGFVNHAPLTFRIGIVPRRFHGPPLRRVTSLSPQRRRRGLACAFY